MRLSVLCEVKSEILVGEKSVDCDFLLGVMFSCETHMNMCENGMHMESRLWFATQVDAPGAHSVILGETQCLNCIQLQYQKNR